MSNCAENGGLAIEETVEEKLVHLQSSRLDPGLSEECRRQSATLAHDTAEVDAVRFIETMGAWHE